MNTPKLIVTLITPIIAVLFFITQSLGTLNNTVLAPEDFCYTIISSKNTCLSPTVQLSGLSCSSAASYIGKPVYSTSTGRIPNIYIPDVCIGGNTFCCAEIEVILSSICADQPQIDITMTGPKYFKITAVHCKTNS